MRHDHCPYTGTPCEAPRRPTTTETIGTLGGAATGNLLALTTPSKTLHLVDPNKLTAGCKATPVANKQPSATKTVSAIMTDGIVDRLQTHDQCWTNDAFGKPQQ